MHRGAGWTSRVAVVIGAVGAVVSGTTGLLALLRHQPLGGIAWLVIPAVPTIALGQLLMIRNMRARRPARRAGDPRVVDRAMMSPRRFFFGDLNKPLSYALLSLAFGGWLLGMTAFATLADGGPHPSRGDCPYVLNNHGSFTCVTKAVYDEAGAAEQRLASGILLAFYCLHLGSAASALSTRTTLQ